MLPVKSQRYLSLDVLRGLTIALMIAVNTPGSWETIYAPFRHAEWHGFTITDLVFPTFLFVVGNAMSFSMKKFQNEKDSVILQKIFKRTFILFFIGLFLNMFPFVTRTGEGVLSFIDFSSIRIMGVLQRIALAYGMAALIIHFLKIRGAVILSIFILIGYWIILYFGGEHPHPYSLEGNAVLKLDLLIFSPENLYQGFGIPFEPEGLLSTLPSVVNVIAGYLTGMVIRQQTNIASTIAKFLLAGALLIIVALIWNLVFPINKPLWTSSYVLYSTGLGLFVLAGLLLVIEVGNVKKWTYFFEVFGKNPLILYILSGILIKIMILIRIKGTSLSGWLYQNLFLSWADGYNASLLFAVFFMLIIWFIGLWMEKRSVYIKV
ncbi:acyltransferase family protein [soil metagenome]